MPIAKINVFEEAKALTQPFLVVDLADIDDFVARLFASEGMVAWHKHIDQEQLFLVVDGELTLESEWGNTMLRSGEMAVIPKAVTHRCGSVSRTIALVFERKFFANRQNGQRRLFALEGGGQVQPVNIGAEAVQLTELSAPRELMNVDELSLAVVRYEGEGEERVCSGGSELLLVQNDGLTLETELGTVTLDRAEMTVVPKGAKYRTRASDRVVVLLATKVLSAHAGH
ncbi:MAG: cupin domain-containing protein [Anaerolineae bacterium]|nr:cupin domain-containing protein [Anaerolineae bacterium]NIN99312.1 cupin domain-containing protein [Anaerolineae bacterium]NIQ82177.1 cupin domain-containing protein [Anaerolineae bacterium]